MFLNNEIRALHKSTHAHTLAYVKATLPQEVVATSLQCRLTSVPTAWTCLAMAFGVGSVGSRRGRDRLALFLAEGVLAGVSSCCFWLREF